MLFRTMIITKGTSSLRVSTDVHLLDIFHLSRSSYLKKIRYNCLRERVVGILFALLDGGIDITECRRAMTHDESMYPDPYTFNPERFFDENGKLNDDNRVLAYGFGRR